jgi:hypothetical protein
MNDRAFFPFSDKEWEDLMPYAKDVAIQIMPWIRHLGDTARYTVDDWVELLDAHPEIGILVNWEEVVACKSAYIVMALVYFSEIIDLMIGS